MEIICVPAIVAIVYGIIELYKLLVKNKKDIYLKIIPVIAGATGGVLGIVLFFAVPSIVIANTWWVALIVGICSGLSAVGSNQIFKQIKKLGIEVKEAEQEDVNKYKQTIEKIKNEIVSFGAWSDEMEEAFKQIEKGNKTNENK